MVLRWSSSFGSVWKLQRLKPECTAAVRIEMRHCFFSLVQWMLVAVWVTLGWSLQIAANTPTKPAIKNPKLYYFEIVLSEWLKKTSVIPVKADSFCLSWTIIYFMQYLSLNRLWIRIYPICWLDLDIWFNQKVFYLGPHSSTTSCT